jgi:hypothetical protein
VFRKVEIKATSCQHTKNSDIAKLHTPLAQGVARRKME